MSDTDKNKDQEKGDEVLRRLLKTPPKPHEKMVKEDPKENVKAPSKKDHRASGRQ